MRSSWSKFVIREIEPDLLPEVYEIERDSFRYPYKNSFLDWLADRYCRTFLVARNEEKVLGYVVASVEGERGHLFSVAVRPGWRNRGVGSALIRELFRRLVSSGVHGIRLEVRKDNSEARSFYRKMGFVENGRVEAYYEDGEDAVVYRRQTSVLHGVPRTPKSRRESRCGCLT